jgi:phosphate:Na+ symporter
MVHIYFNILGTIFFLVGIYSLKAVIGFSFWDDPITKGGIANFHTLFNVVTTLLFLPFNRFLVFLAEHTIRESKS